MGQHVTLALVRPRSEQPGRYVTLRLGPPAVPVVVLPETLPTALVGAPYTHVVTATGGTGPHTFAVTSGSLPPGVTLASGGTFSGTPTSAGSASFAVTATDALAATGTRSYTIAITDPTWRGLLSSIGLPWTRRHARQRAIASGWDESPPLTAGVRAPWSAGVARLREIRLDWSPTVPKTAALSARWGTRAPLTRQVTARWDDLPAVSAQWGVPWATPAPMSRPLLIPWAAPPPAQRSWGAPWAAPLSQVRSWGTPWLNPPHKQRGGEQGGGWRGRCGRGCGHGMTPGQIGAATRWVTEFALLSALPERFTTAPWLAVRFAPSVDGFITHCASHLSPARERPHHCGRLSVLLPERSAAACAFGGAALPSSKVGHSLLTAAIVSLLCVDQVAQSQR